MPETKLIALDLDGTLLNSDKELTERTRCALEAAAEAGIEIVPATGRFYRGMPRVVRELPFVRYVITINGAEVLDLSTGERIYSADIPAEEAAAFFAGLDSLPVIYDCYMDGWGYMTASMQERAAFADCFPLAEIISITASASVSPIFPLRKARFVNSPA